MFCFIVPQNTKVYFAWKCNTLQVSQIRPGFLQDFIGQWCMHLMCIQNLVQGDLSCDESIVQKSVQMCLTLGATYYVNYNSVSMFTK